MEAGKLSLGSCERNGPLSGEALALCSDIDFDRAPWCFLARKTLRQAQVEQYGQPYFGHVEPTAIF